MSDPHLRGLPSVNVNRESCTAQEPSLKAAVCAALISHLSVILIHASNLK